MIIFNSGRSVAVHPAMMQEPASAVLHREMWTACQKKSLVLRIPLTYLKRIMEQIVPLMHVSHGSTS